MRQHNPNIYRLSARAVDALRTRTVDYAPDPRTYQENKKRALYALAGVGGISILSGGPGLAGTVLAAYAGMKGYQAFRDYKRMQTFR